MNNPIRTFALALAACLTLPFGGQVFAGTPSVKLPAYKKLVLKNGLTVLLMEQHKVPLVSVNYLMKSGSTADPAGKEGLATLTGDLLRKGTKTRTADQIADSLDSVGASLNVWSDFDCTGGSAEFMKKDVVAGMGLVADLLQNPSFPEAEVKKLTAQRIDGIQSAKDRAQGVINSYFYGFLFGKHPYGRPLEGDEKSNASITRDDVVKFHQAHYTPSNLILSIVGDFATADMEKLVKERFSGWTSQGRPAPASLAKAEVPQGKRVLLVDKPDATQTFFMLGHVGVARNNPDRVGIDVVNVLFGGRFTSMINTALRIESGLTYGAKARFDKGRMPGAFYITSYTANATTEKAMDLALETLRQLHAKGITEEDLASAKAYIKGTLPPRLLETQDQLATLLAEIHFYGLSDAEVNDFYAKVDALTLADAKRIIATYYPEKNLSFVLIGKASEIDTVAKKYASDRKTKSITEPGF